jgi:hypothetical protein
VKTPPKETFLSKPFGHVEPFERLHRQIYAPWHSLRIQNSPSRIVHRLDVFHHTGLFFDDTSDSLGN